MLNWLKTRSNRVWVYLVGVAAAPILVHRGVTTDNEVALWLGLLWTILGLGMATVNTNERNE